ncbi:MAG: hypothetical protein NT004_03915 [Bacteroidetes bacterium]|nr:hypothetical protein [Bacteroidota bacterium]
MFLHRPTEMKPPENPGFRFYIGLAIFITSFFMLPIGLTLREFVVGSFWKGFVLAIFWISAPLMKIGSIALLGKSSYAWINYRMHYIYHHVAKPHKVTPLRYNIGLALFILPFLPNYMISFMPHMFHITLHTRYFIIIASDVVFIFSLFVLGGDFWDKLRALFIYKAKATFEDDPKKK